MWWNGGGIGWAGWLAMALTMVAFSALLVVSAVAVWRAVTRDVGRGADASVRTPDRLLDERFARGEIDEDEYLRRRDVLRSAR